jgi:hypothetical protein
MIPPGLLVLSSPGGRRDLGQRGQRNLPIDPGRSAPGVALGDLTNADQRVRPGPQHQILQRPDRGPVLLPRRLEDPPPQPDFGAFVDPPVNGVPLQSLVLGSVHCEAHARHRRGGKLYPFTVSNLSLSSSGSLPWCSRLTCPRQRPFVPDRQVGIRPVTPRPPPGAAAFPPRVPAAFRPPASACWASSPAEGFRPSHDRPTGPSNNPDPDGVSTFRAHETRPGWVPPVRSSPRPLLPRTERGLTPWAHVAELLGVQPAFLRSLDAAGLLSPGEAERQSQWLAVRHRVLRAGAGTGRDRVVKPVKMMKGDNLTEQFSRTPPDDGRQVAHQGLFRVAGQDAGERDPAARSIAPSAAAQPSWDVFSHGSEYDVVEQQRPEHDEVAMRSLQLPFEAEADIVDAIDQLRPVPVDEDDYR